jgi:hypothetical protein
MRHGFDCTLHALVDSSIACRDLFGNDSRNLCAWEKQAVQIHRPKAVRNNKGRQAFRPDALFKSILFPTSTQFQFRFVSIDRMSAAMPV